MPKKPVLAADAAAVHVPFLRTSERRDFKRCQYRWWWAWRQGLRSPEPDLKLWFGTGIHLALAHYYGRHGFKRNKDMVEVFRAFVADDIKFIRSTRTGEWDDSEFVEAGKLGEIMLAGYMEEYGGDPDWEVIYVEHPFQINIPTLDGNGVLVVYAGTFDGVIRHRVTGKVYLLEHKTAATVTLGHLQMDDQAGSYWAVATQTLRADGVLGPKERIHGIIYNFLRKALPDDRPRNADGYYCNKPKKDDYVQQLRAAGVEGVLTASLPVLEELAARHSITVLGEVSKVQPKPLYVRHTVERTARERQTQIQRIQGEAVQMDLIRSGAIKPSKNPTRDCSWDCQFHNMCELHEMQAGWEEFRDDVLVVRDPYADHRKSASTGD